MAEWDSGWENWKGKETNIGREELLAYHSFSCSYKPFHWGERNPNWKSNFNQDICVFCILFSRAERAKFRAMLIEAIRKEKKNKDRKRSFKLNYSRVLFNFAAPQSVPFHLSASWRTISYYLETWVIWSFFNSMTIMHWQFSLPVHAHNTDLGLYSRRKEGKEYNYTTLCLYQQYWAERKRL